MMNKYKTILADPPWQEKWHYSKSYKHKSAISLPYSTMSLQQIKALQVNDYASAGCHLWLWTTNQYLRDGFEVMETWGFKYLAPITWVKPSGFGFRFIHRTQTLLFGYKDKCILLNRNPPTVIFANPTRHSAKPDTTYDYIEAISPAPRLELFARRKRLGWDVWGNEVDCDVQLEIPKETVEQSKF